MKVFHVVIQSDYGKVTVVNLGRVFLPEQISIIFIPVSRTVTALQHIAKQSRGLRDTLYEMTGIISPLCQYASATQLAAGS